MKKLKILLLSLLALSATVGGIAFAASIPVVPSVFETYVASQQGTGDTTLVLASNTLRDGTILSGYVCLTVDSNTPTLEYECGTAATSSLTVTGVTRGIDAVSGTTTVSSLQFAHRRGADVKITDYPVLTLLSRIMNALDSVPNILSYGTSTNFTLASTSIPYTGYVDSVGASSTNYVNSNFFRLSASNTASGSNIFSNTNTFSGVTTFSVPPVSATNPVSGTQVANKQYVDGVAISGAPIATNSLTGIGRVATSTQYSTGYASTTPYFLTSDSASSTASTTNSIIVATNATTGVIDTSFINLTFGDGSDGNVTVSSGTTTLSRDMYYNNLTVSGSGAILTGGYRIFVANTLTVNTTGTGITNPGGNGGAGTSSTGGTAGSAAAGGTLPAGTAGTAGIWQNGGSGANGIAGIAKTFVLNNVSGAAGGGGGSGTTGGAGGAATSASTASIRQYVGGMNPFAFTSSTTLQVPNIIPGSGGGASTNNDNNISGAGGGGGGSGGYIFIAARSMVLTNANSISAPGGGGGAGEGAGGSGSTGGGGGGGGGSGGIVIASYLSKTGAGTITAPGGAGGLGGAHAPAGSPGSAGKAGIVVLLNPF